MTTCPECGKEITSLINVVMPNLAVAAAAPPMVTHLDLVYSVDGLVQVYSSNASACMPTVIPQIVTTPPR